MANANYLQTQKFGFVGTYPLTLQQIQKNQHHRNDMKVTSFKLLSVLIVLTSLSQSSCDTPQSIAWTHYYCAVDAMKEGKLDKAKHFLEMVDKNRDRVLADKTDSLMKVIEEEMKNHTFSDN